MILGKVTRGLKRVHFEEKRPPGRAAHKQTASPTHLQSGPASPCSPHPPAALSFCPWKTPEKLTVHFL